MAVIGFSVLVSLIATGASLLITLVGIPVLVLTCWAARALAQVERRRISRLDRTAPRTAYYARPRRGIVGMIDVLRDRQGWRDVLHGLLSLPVTCLTWSIAVAWSATVLFALSWPLFGHFSDGDRRHDRDIADKLGVHSYGARSLIYAATGALLLVTLPFVLRGLAAAQARFGRTLLFAADKTVGVPRARAAFEGAIVWSDSAQAR